MPPVTPAAWDAFLVGHPKAHLLQTAAWGALKSGFGWQAIPLIAGACGAQVLFRRLPLGLTLAYIPKGPVGSLTGWAALWPEVDALCRKRRAIFLKVEPDLWEGDPAWPSGGAIPPGFCRSPHEIQPRRSLLVDLRPPEEAILAKMKQKTRYNIRLAERKGVRIHQSRDLQTFYELMLLTGARDGFGVHHPDYYRRAFELFEPGGQCALFLAEFEGQPLAGLMVFARGGRAWYFYGASANEQRERMPTYLLQWRAMQWARARGCGWYDLWGVPDADLEALEAGFAARNDGLWGVYRFKRGFGGELRRALPAWDRVYNPLMYRLYLWRTARQTEVMAV